MQPSVQRQSHETVDSPLKRRRLQMRITQEELARLCGCSKHTIAKYEQIKRIPRGDEAIRLIEVTGLPTEAIMLPKQYLRDHPEERAEFAEQAAARGRSPGTTRPPRH